MCPLYEQDIIEPTFWIHGNYLQDKSNFKCILTLNKHTIYTCGWWGGGWTL